MTDTDPTQNYETLDTILPETSPERAATYEIKDLEQHYHFICGDDRELTEKSAEALSESDTERIEAFLRYYGGAYGITRVLLTTLLAMGQNEIIAEQFGGSFTEATRSVKHDVEKFNNVSLDLHTAEGNEEGSASFNLNSTKAPGCAYGANIAVIGTLCYENEALKQLTRREGIDIEGGDLGLSETVRMANKKFVEHFATEGAAGMSRQDFAAVDTSIAVLEGDHAKPVDVVAVLNFTHDKISNPKRANSVDKPFYNNDVTQVAELLMRTYPDLHLVPEILFAVMDQDIRATRAALAGGDATAIRQERLGDPKEAIEYLYDLQSELNQHRG